MADRIYDLTNNPAPADDVVLVIDNASFAEAQSTTKSQLLADEVATRTAADTAIKTGAGLEADGSLASMGSSTYLKDTNYAAAAYAKNLKNGLLLLDSAISAVASGNTLDVQVSLTSAEILALFSSPTIKLAAPGAGTFYHITEVVARNNFGTAAYVCNAAGIQMRFDGASDYITVLTQAFVQAVATTRKKFPVAEHTLPLNTAIEFFAPVADPTNGDGTIDVIITYKIVSDFSGVPTSPACCVSPLAATFTNADLTAAGNLVITHNLLTENIFVVILDNTGASVAANYKTGDESNLDKTNKVTVPVGVGITGTWKYFIFAIQ